MTRISLCACAAIVALTSGCETNQQTGRLVGAGGGAAIGGVMGRVLGRSTAATMLGGAGGAFVGSLIGGTIGSRLDQRDQQLASQATQRALSEPVRYTSASATPSQGSQQGNAPEARAPAARRAVLPRASSAARWTSDHSDARGSATVVEVQPTNSGGECRTIREVAYVGGQEISQEQRYCRDGSSQWQKA